ncbi:MAG: transcriptional repressor [Clostridia bacterium]
MNYSKQRETILNVLKCTKSHPTAEWVFEQTKKEIPNISLGTVYRNLQTLVQIGMLIKIQGTFEKEHYDANTTDHFHFVCSKCGCVEDLEIAELDKLKPTLSAFKQSVKANAYTLNYYGICNNCQNIKLED